MDDISALITEDQANHCCPLCDNAIEAWDQFAVVKAHGFVVIVHDMCLESEDDDDGDDDA